MRKELRCGIKPALVARGFRAKEAPAIRVILLVVEIEFVFSSPCFDFSKAVLLFAFERLLAFVLCIAMTLQVGVICERLAKCTVGL
jgi:hypothetical protein